MHTRVSELPRLNKEEELGVDDVFGFFAQTTRFWFFLVGGVRSSNRGAGARSRSIGCAPAVRKGVNLRAQIRVSKEKKVCVRPSVSGAAG